jgi:hypothetical protein
VLGAFVFSSALVPPHLSLLAADVLLISSSRPLSVVGGVIDGLLFLVYCRGDVPHGGSMQIGLYCLLSGALQTLWECYESSSCRGKKCSCCGTLSKGAGV